MFDIDKHLFQYYANQPFIFLHIQIELYKNGYKHIKDSNKICIVKMFIQIISYINKHKTKVLLFEKSLQND